MNVVVGVITFRRPQQLQILLASISERLDLGAAELEAIVIVDNDPAGSAEQVVANFEAQHDFPVRYLVEPQPGVSAARNALAAAAEGADWLAMVDDDETIVGGWPGELLRVGVEHSATIVGGTVEADLGDEDAPDWFHDSIFFGRTILAEGAPMDHVPSGNCAIHLARASVLEGRFYDDRFGRSGGEDSFFSMRVKAAGGRTVFAPNAVTREMYPPERVNLAWLNRRWRRSGQTLVAIDNAMTPLSVRAKALTAARAGARIVVATGLAATAIWKQPRQRQLWAASRHVMLAVGTLRGLSGWQPDFYGPTGSETLDTVTSDTDHSQ